MLATSLGAARRGEREGEKRTLALASFMASWTTLSSVSGSNETMYRFVSLRVAAAVAARRARVQMENFIVVFAVWELRLWYVEM